MKKIYLLFNLLLGTLFSSTNVFSQAPLIQWQKCLGGSYEDQAYSVCQTFDSGYVIAGYSGSLDGDVSGNHGYQDYWIVKLSKYGSIVWQKSFGGSSADYAHSVQQTSDSGFIIAGLSGSIDGDVNDHHGGVGNDDYWVVKLSADGNLLWTKSLGGSGDDRANSVAQTSDGGYVVTGWSTSDDGDVIGNHGGGDIWIAKLSPSGNLLWQKCLGGSAEEYGESIQQTTDGGYIIAAYTHSIDGDVTGNHGGVDYWVVKLDDTGAIQWQKCLGGSNGDAAFCIQQTFDEGYIVAGYSSSVNGDVTGVHGGADFWVVKLSTAGMIQWQKSLGSIGNEIALFVQQTSDSGYVVVGYTDSSGGDVTGHHVGAQPRCRDFWIVKLSQLGSLEWQKCMGSIYDSTSIIIRDNEATCVRQTYDKGYIVVGFENGYGGEATGNHGHSDYWVVKLAAVSAINLVEKSTSFSIYPNPTTTSLTVTAPYPVTSISITSILGQTLYTQSYNSDKVQIDVTHLPPGIYFLKINGTEIYKFIKK